MFAAGRPYRALPGPSVLPESVLAAMQRSAPNIYAEDLRLLTEGLWPDLLSLVSPAPGTKLAAYIGNGHAAWEAALSNLFSPGDKVLAATSGLFGLGWANAARARGLEVQHLDGGQTAALEPGALEAALRADKGHKIKAVLVTHVDTASSVRNDLQALRAALEAAGHPALLLADCIASLGCDRVDMAGAGLDLVLAASQKGLMCPPGLSFLWYSEKAARAGVGAALRSPYWDWGPRAEPADYWHYWHGTAPTHHLYALRAALDLMKAEGMEGVLARHAGLARAVWAAAEVWFAGMDPGLGARLNVADPGARSHAVTSLRFGGQVGAALRDWCERVGGLTLGIGLGMGDAADPEGAAWARLAHMGHVNAHMTLGALGVIEAGLTALGLPHGKGAVEAAAAVLAEAAGR